MPIRLIGSAGTKNRFFKSGKILLKNIEAYIVVLDMTLLDRTSIKIVWNIQCGFGFVDSLVDG